MGKKISLEAIPKKPIMATLHALRWFFFLIFLFITVGIIALFLIGGETYVQMVLTYSIAGFFTFFMGYFGWILAQGVIDNLSKNEDMLQNELSYYSISKSKKFKY
jgi:hypothetical protein